LAVPDTAARPRLRPTVAIPNKTNALAGEEAGAVASR